MFQRHLSWGTLSARSETLSLLHEQRDRAPLEPDIWYSAGAAPSALRARLGEHLHLLEAGGVP